MKLFKSSEPNTFHYITAVTFQRVPIFLNDIACGLFIETLAEIRSIHPLKLVGYVIMPDHVHLIINPKIAEISVILRKVKGKSARKILDWLIENGHDKSLNKLRLDVKHREYAVWQKDSSSIDLFSPRFLRQKLNYIHMNPVRADLCEAPQDWRWSSYSAYFPKAAIEVPIQIDINPFWKTEPEPAGKPASKRR
jgi:putative transposase